MSTSSAAEFLPAKHTLPKLREAAHCCQGCELFRNVTQTVFGAGQPKAALMVVGETPGDQEDLAGLPFVGPAGRLLEQCFIASGIERSETYLTNAVKHFKWEPRGKRRLHAKPSLREIRACRPWLEAEIEAVEPQTIICLGATASQSLLGNDFRITRQRGQFIASDWAENVIASWHPSAILRAPAGDRARMQEELLADLTLARSTCQPQKSVKPRARSSKS